jgi:glycosyltransferase involved in cell wall biosynthesis
LKILVLQSELGVLRGGGENFTRNLFAEFTARGHQVTAVFTADRFGRYPISLPSIFHAVPLPGWWPMALGQSTLSSIGKHISRIGSLRKEWDRFQGALQWRAFRWYRKRFQRRVEQEFAFRWRDYDAVYVHGNVTLASHVARYRPTVLRVPGPVAADLEPTLRKIHMVCANGDALDRIREFLGDHAAELPIGIDTQLFTPGTSSVRVALKWTEQHKIIGYVGRLSYLKGIDFLATVFGKVLVREPNARLLIIGNGEGETAIRSQLSEPISKGLVHMEPDVDHQQLPRWYRSMDLLVMPSRYENFSNSLLEGMACGVPFLASDVGGNRILGKTGAGYLFESGSVESLGECLHRVIGDRAEMKARGTLGPGYVSARYSWKTSAERLERVISERLGVKI